MNLKKNILFFLIFFLLFSCADYSSQRANKKKNYYSSLGFALLYEENLFLEKKINKKINNDELVVMHSSLKINTPIKIINLDNGKFVNVKVNKKAIYPKIFNVVISKKIASTLELDINDPYVEVIEVKKNKKFVAKKSNTFDEEKEVAGKAPVDDIEINNITDTETNSKMEVSINKNFLLHIADFYYFDSADNLKNDLVQKTKFDNIHVKKLGDNKYRLIIGPFKNFNALKTSYISLNDLGFENLNIYRE